MGWSTTTMSITIPAEPEPVRGRDKLRDSIETIRAGFGLPHVRIYDQVAEGDKVVTRFTITGRHDGALFGVPPTGNEVEFSGITIQRLDHGQIVETWESWDTLASCDSSAPYRRRWACRPNRLYEPVVASKSRSNFELQGDTTRL